MNLCSPSNAVLHALKLVWIYAALFSWPTAAELHGHRSAIDDARVRCVDPGAPRNGGRFVVGAGAGKGGDTSFAVSTEIGFRCGLGYRLRGASRLVCVRNEAAGGDSASAAHWNGQRPECVPNSRWSVELDTLHHSVLRRGTECPDFGDPENGFRTLQDSPHGTVRSLVTFGCNRGFELDGAKRLICRQGEWNGAWPQCIPARERAMCGDPGNIYEVFGRRFVEGTSEGSTVTYSCVKGLALSGGDAVRTCLSSGEWSGQLPTCRVINCGQPLPPENGTVDGSNFGYGFTVVYSCNAGHVLEGEREVTCLETGSWSSGPPICRAVQCHDLPRLHYGSVSHPSPPMYMDEATYHCDTGYGLVGRDTRRCMSNGEWSGEVPTCQRGHCDELQRPQNGEIFFSQSDLGEIVTYACLHGYYLVGRAVRVCQGSGRWSDYAPHCEPSTCSNISVPPTVRYSLTNANFVFSVANLWCGEGYVLIGSNWRECLAIGIWSGRIPGCIPIVCPILYPPTNGNFSLSDRRCYRSEATYSCDVGYILYGGDMIRTCQENMQWSGREPCCIRESIECQTLSDIDNGRVEMDGRVQGSIATYSCNPGYMLQGDALRICTEDGVWSNSEPMCNINVMCSGLLSPQFGEVNISSTDVGGLAQYSCLPGYLLSGDGTRTCLETGTWSGNPPTCERGVDLMCSGLLGPQFGEVNISSTDVGGLAQYSCLPGYVLSGDGTRTCLETGTWSGNPPTCEPVDCGALVAPENGSVTVTMTTLGGVASYTCDSSFRLIGMDSRQCPENGTWSGDAPVCEIIACPVLAAPQFGFVSYESEDRMVDSTATYICEPRYSLVGEANRTCLETGTWNGAEATCELLECPALSDPSNGMVAIVDAVPGGVAVYLCNAGFVLEGEGSRVCERVGQRGTRWSGAPPTCRQIRCPLLDDPANGQVTTPPPYFVNATVLYICDAGYELRDGSIRRVCMADGTWSGSAPTCVLSRISCPDLDDPEFGSVEIRGDGTLGSTAVYQCDVGYEVVGEAERECLLDGLVGEWSGEAPTCRAVMCQPLEEPVDGVLRITGLTVNSLTLYFCNSGFKLNGPVRRQCLPTGEWDGNETLCDPVPGTVSCGRLDDPDNGMVNLSSTLPGSVATYSCILGYVLVDGPRERHCQDNGTWDSNEPSCNVVDCGPLSDPTNGIVLVSVNTTLGTTASYECIAGYEVVGLMGEFRFCTETGMWSERDPTCERVDCGSLSPPVNGVVDQLRGTRFMDVTLYSCLEGYILMPPESRSRTCTSMGEWSGENPICELRASTVDCGSLAPPAKGQVSFLNSSTGQGALVEYSCRPGYMVEGVALRQCQSNGEWSGIAPVCTVHQCPPLQNPDNGQVFVVGTTVNSSATYLCNFGFQLVGLVRRVCQNDGGWTGDDTRCLRMEDVICPSLTPPTNGSVEINEGGRDVGSEATYDCDEGFELEGPQRRTCQSNGAWSGRVPTCKRIQCPDPGIPSNARRFEASFDIGNSVLFLCSDGFDLDGMPAVTCLDDGTWSEGPPTCTMPSTSTTRRSRRGSCSVDGEEVVTELGERCRCVAGQLGSCCRYRREWSQLTPEEQLHYLVAVTTASSDPQYRPFYVHIMQLYLEAFESVVMSNDPTSSQFFPWHRYYLHLYEDLLRVIDRSVTIPYWDWTVHPQKPYDSPVFDPILGFGNSVDNVTHCINSGPFRQGDFAMTPQAGGGCIRRTFGDFPFLNRQLLNSILSLPASSFDQFHSTLQLFFHFPIRCFIGGTMCTTFASEDPVYLLLLAQLDRLLHVWQAQDDERASVRYANDPTPLPHTLEMTAVKLTVSDYSSNKQLPYGTSVCYSQEPPL